MRRVSRKNITKEILFEAEDGRRFAYEGLALDHDIELAAKEIEDCKRGDINIPDLNLVGEIYRIDTKEEMSKIEKYCDHRDLTLSNTTVPALVIVTNTFAVNVEDLKKVSMDIAKI